MARSGPLLTYVDTYADLRARAGVVDQMIVVNCRTSHGDGGGGGGTFYWGDADIDNDGTVITTSAQETRRSPTWPK
jgi:hypothetical protein